MVAHNASKLLDAEVKELIRLTTPLYAPATDRWVVFEAYRAVCDGAGLHEHPYAACFYSLGAAFAPNWIDWPMLYAGNSVPLALGMGSSCT